MTIESNLKPRSYNEKEIIRIYNRDQQTFYIDSGIYPIDLYPSYSPKNDRKITVMLFLKNDTKEVYMKWKNYE